MKLGQREEDRRWMALAVAEAEARQGCTAPNPTVGAVVVRGGRLLATGSHARAGAPHAEVVALAKAKGGARGGTLYTSLEPCNHHGRTPPCTEAILQAGIARVVYASQDPNPLVRGSGLRRLRRQGVAVHGGVLQAEADALNRGFFQRMLSGRPWVTLKLAVSLDGKMAVSNGQSKWMTSESARTRVHQLREQVDAVLVGAGTVLADNPRLTVRLDRKARRQPQRWVLDGLGRASAQAQIFSKVSGALPTGWLISDRVALGRRRAMEARGVEVHVVPATRGVISWTALLAYLGKQGVNELLVEGGASVASGLLKAGCVDELWWFQAPALVGNDGLAAVGALGALSMKEIRRFAIQSVEQVGSDVLWRLLPADH